MKMSRLFCAAAAAAAITAGATTVGATGERMMAVSIRMAAEVGGKPFACANSYDGIGTTKSTVKMTDFRFYVSNVRLTKADGSSVPVTLTQDGLWQNEGVALVDFEDATGTCTNGTPQTHTSIEGAIPEGTYTGIAFEIGLPFDKNHRDPAAQASPLNLTRLFWSWNAGYKFMRLDMRTTGMPNGWVIHLGSTGCEGGTGATTAPASCRFPNRAPIVVSGFNPATDTLVMDVARMLADSNVDINQEKTAVGCMSAQNDSDCGPLFGRLGLAFGETAARPQQVFAVRK